jgi:hypothetical protein
VELIFKELFYFNCLVEQFLLPADIAMSFDTVSAELRPAMSGSIQINVWNCQIKFKVLHLNLNRQACPMFSQPFLALTIVRHHFIHFIPERIGVIAVMKVT